MFPYLISVYISGQFRQLYFPEPVGGPTRTRTPQHQLSRKVLSMHTIIVFPTSNMHPNSTSELESWACGYCVYCATEDAISSTRDPRRIKSDRSRILQRLISNSPGFPIIHLLFIYFGATLTKLLVLNLFSIVVLRFLVVLRSPINNV